LPSTSHSNANRTSNQGPVTTHQILVMEGLATTRELTRNSINIRALAGTDPRLTTEPFGYKLKTYSTRSAAIAMHCCPSIVKETGLATMEPPVWKSHSGLPLCASSA
jgi:hypothetical protein